MSTVNELFQTRAIKDIRDIELKTREEIQIKQNELRQLVGERYHDLIDVSDNISKIQQMCAECLVQLEQATTEVDVIITTSQSATLFGDKGLNTNQPEYDEQDKINKYYEVTDWMSVCCQRKYYLAAAVCCFSAEHIQSEISSLREHTKLARLKQQLCWTSEKELSRFDLRDVDVAHHVATLLLLDRTLPVNLFLNKRVEAIRGMDQTTPAHEVLHAMQSTLILLRCLFEPRKDSMIESIIKGWDQFSHHFIKQDQLFKTVYQKAISSEYEKAGAGLVLSLSQTELQQHSESFVEKTLGHVQNLIKKVADSTNSAFSLIKLEEAVQRNLMSYDQQFGHLYEWTKEASLIWNSLTKEIPSLDLWNNNLKQMFREREVTLISESFDTITLDPSQYDTVDSTAINAGSLIWTRPPLTELEIVERYHKRVNNNESLNPYSYFPSPAVNNMNDFSVNQQTPQDNHGRLYQIQVTGVTNETTLCIQSLWQQLRITCQDLMLLLGRSSRSTQRRGSTGSSSSTPSTPRRTHEDEHDVLIETTLFNQLFKCFDHVASIINNYMDQESSRMLYCARLSQCLHQLCLDLCNEILFDTTRQKNKLKALMAHYHLQMQRKQRTNAFTAIPTANTLQEDCADQVCKNMIALEKQLEQIYTSGHEQWIQITSDHFANQIKNGLCNENWKCSRRHLWAEIQVSTDEIANDQQEIFPQPKNDRVYVPTHPSYHVHDALHQVNKHLYRVGAFQVEKSVSRRLAMEMSRKAFDEYSEFVREMESSKIEQRATAEQVEQEKQQEQVQEEEQTEESDFEKMIQEQQIEPPGANQDKNEKVTEDGCLQLMFDVRFLGDILLGKPYDRLSVQAGLSNQMVIGTERAYVNVMESLSKSIDPVTWVIYEKFFNESVNACVMNNRLLVPIPLPKHVQLRARSQGNSAQSTPNSSVLSAVGRLGAAGGDAGGSAHTLVKLCDAGQHLNLLPIPGRDLLGGASGSPMTPYVHDFKKENHDDNNDSFAAAPASLGRKVIGGALRSIGLW
ncbi:oligomeric Golgi complex subunit 1 [Acrasis kona]|uniref:Conserved oligomeric Golgi complex subunit 1 n=1 Tax=Acrasis kona TaxID=1008807 RepID=A0AAW2ZFU5_9EUKA